jgi:hypothetical protein
MPATYDHKGIRFQYPENWVLDNRDADSLPGTVTLQLPSGGFWSLDVHPFGVRPGDLIHEMIRSLESEYQDVEVTVVDETIEGEKVEGVDLYFYYMDLLIAAQVRSLRYGHATYLLTYQAEDREFDKMLPVFQAVSTSLFRESAARNGSAPR